MSSKIILLNSDEMLLFCEQMQQAYNNKSKENQRQENKHKNNIINVGGVNHE